MPSWPQWCAREKSLFQALLIIQDIKTTYTSWACIDSIFVRRVLSDILEERETELIAIFASRETTLWGKMSQERWHTTVRQFCAATEWRHPSCSQKVLEWDAAVPEATGADRRRQAYNHGRRYCLGDQWLNEELYQHIRSCEDQI